MNRLVKNYTKWISDFTTEQFDDVVETYIECVWKIDNLKFVDGPHDGGNDLKVFVNNEELKIQVQITVQENNINGKINKDCINAQANHANYGYQPLLHFFYAQPISEEKTNEFKSMASSKYGIQLNLMDAKHIANFAKDYPEIKNSIRKQYGLPAEYDTSEELDETKKLVFDLMSFGDDSIEIKTQIITSYISHFLFENDGKTKKEIIDACNVKFQESIDSKFYSKVISRLQTNHIIKWKDATKKELILSTDETNRINDLKEEFRFQEQKMQIEIQDLLSNTNISLSVDEIIGDLTSIFESSFIIDYYEIKDEGNQIDYLENHKLYKEFFKKIIEQLGTKEEALKFMNSLFSVCTSNDILQKLCAGKLFTKFIDSKQMQNYINVTERNIYIDTQLVLHILCLYYQNSNYRNPFFQATKDLLGTVTEYSNINLFFTTFYLREVSYHFKEALSLIPFEEIGVFEELGGTNNVFYNYYEYLKKQRLLDEEVENFADFMAGFDLYESDALDIDFFKICGGLVSEILEHYRIETISVPHYEIDKAVRYFEKALEKLNRFKPPVTLDNDAIMLVSLFDKNLHIIEPIFTTWDHSFFLARNIYYAKNRGERLWHLLTPNKLVNHISLLKFNIDSESLSRDILSVIDDSFNIYQKSQKLIDSISRILNLRTETGRRYIEQIKRFKKEYVYKIANMPEPSDPSSDATYPIEQLIYGITKHFIFNTKYEIEQIKLVFQSSLHFESIIKLFEKELQFMVENRKQSNSFYSELEQIVTTVLNPT